LDSNNAILAVALDASPVVDWYVTFRSKEYSDAAAWPTLTVEYDGVPPFEPFSLVPFQDTYVKASSSGNNYGEVNRINVKMNDDRNAYLKFDIGTVPERAPQVLLRLWAYMDRQADTSVCEVSSPSDWQESSMNWNNRPTLGAIIETQPYPVQYESVAFDVTDYVNA
jgi:hypothetical protein